MSGWLKFWEQANRIYVNDRHRTVHYARVADDILAVLPPGPPPVVLDYGCGDALEAPRVAKKCRRLWLYDASQAVRTRLHGRFPQAGTILVADEIAAVPDGAIDVIVINSVIQYLTRDELDRLLAQCRRLLAAGGVLVIADVIPPDAGAVADISALLRTGLRHGFFGAALVGIAVSAVSDYRRLRRDLGLATYDERGFLALLAAAGFAARRRTENFGFNTRRFTLLAGKSS
jgi:ubiquinone/menaquinone biosynthesis C-methylase UbiE